MKDVVVDDTGDSISVTHMFELYSTVKTINSEPAGEVYINRKKMGLAPLKNVRLKEGTHRLGIVKTGFKTLIKNIEIVGGKDVPALSFKLEKITFSNIELIHVHPWGNVYIDDKSIGESPLRNVKVLPGEHTIKVEHPKFKTVIRMIEVKKGEDIPKINILLTKKKKEK